MRTDIVRLSAVALLAFAIGALSQPNEGAVAERGCTSDTECLALMRARRRARRALHARAGGPSPTLTTVYSTCPVASQTTSTFLEYIPSTTTITQTATSYKCIATFTAGTSQISYPTANSIPLENTQLVYQTSTSTVTSTLPTASPVTSDATEFDPAMQTYTLTSVSKTVITTVSDACPVYSNTADAYRTSFTNVVFTLALPAPTAYACPTTTLVP